MYLFLIEWLRAMGHKIPFVFEYTSTRMVLAVLTSLSLCLLWGPSFIALLYQWKIGQPIRKEDCPLLGELHEKKKDTPTMGGVLILSAMLLSLLLWMDWKSPFTWLLLAATLILGGLGAVDDYLKLKYRNSRGLKGRYKLLVQCLFSSLLCVYLLVPGAASYLQQGSFLAPPVAKEVILPEQVAVKGETEVLALPLHQYMGRIYLPFIKEPVLEVGGWGLLGLALFFMVVISGSSNAVNLTDGLDGLASGCLIMASAPLALVAFLSNHSEIARYLNILYIEGSGEIAIYLCALIGGCLGFLWYNGYPAQVFMGDTGSLGLGGILAVCALLLRREFLLALSGGIFVAEALSVILQVGSYKLRHKKRIFLCSPLHHHFEYKGWPETKVVMRFWIIGFILSLIGLASLKFQ
jgi:phospho-N-acetylmuramoyl-pentapeptide-transferase